jgi:hypothetical protein
MPDAHTSRVSFDLVTKSGVGPMASKIMQGIKDVGTYQTLNRTDISAAAAC